MSRDDLHNRPPNASANGDAAGDALVDRLTEVLREAPVPDGPDEPTLARALGALRAAQESAERGPIPVAQMPGRPRTMKALLKLAIAACVVVGVGVVFLAAPFRQTVAFARVVDQVKQAGSVRFKTRSTVKLPDGKIQKGESTTLIVGSRMWQDTGGSVQLMDFDAGEMVVLQPDDKKAMRVTMPNRPREEPMVNLLDEFRAIDPDKAKDLGVREFDGRKLRGFLVRKPGNEMTVWVDPTSQSPVRIEATIDMPTVPYSYSVMTDFAWGVADGQELSMEVPKGYDVRSLEMDVSPPTEKDLLDGLRVMAKLNEGRFPATLDRAALGAAIKKRTPNRPPTPAERDAFQAEITTQIMKIGRGLSFVTPANGEDWRYAGDGVSLDQPGRAVLWYKPAGADRYRVVYADLSVSDTLLADLPKVDSKILTAGPTPFPTTTRPSEPRKR